MPIHPIHTIASAPENSKSALEQLQQAFGVIPNLAVVISKFAGLRVQPCPDGLKALSAAALK